MQFKVWSSPILMLLSIAACDDENRAPAKCRALAKAACEQFVDCGLVDEEDLDDCRDQLETEGGSCDDAVRVGSSYGECLEDLKSSECPASLTLPDSCNDAVSIKE